MIEFVRDNLLVILAALLIAAVLLWLVLRPRQRVRLTESTPMRPHMAAPTAKAEPSRGGIADEVGARAKTVTGQNPDVALTAESGGDDFHKLKGVGPKFAEILVGRGFTRYEQLASLTAEEINRLDNELGPFRGRLQRDRIVEQAAYLARGDTDGFQQHFGKL